MKKSLLILIISVLSRSLLFSQNIDVTIDVYHPVCPGDYGTLYANVTISSNFTMSWSNGGTYYYNYVQAGTYSVTVTDIATGDTAMAIATVIDPPGLTFSTGLPGATCSGLSNGSIDLTVYGNTAPYQYNWSNGSTNQDLYNIPAGNYSVTVSDASYCNYYLNNVIVSEIPPAIVSATSTDASCGVSDGSVTATIVGAKAGDLYFYLWDDPNHSTTAIVNNLAAGIYNVTVTTDLGCLSYGSAIVNNFGAPYLIPYYTNILCHGNHTGTASVNAQGGIPPFTYHWSNYDTTNVSDSLFAGIYTVTVTDLAGCQSIQTFDITEPPAFNVFLNKQNVPCSNYTGGGSMWVTAEGGVPNYTYLWSNAESTSGIYDVTAGIYSVTVSDANSCTVILSDTVFDAVPIVIDSVVTDPVCAGGWSGSIDITVSGGNPPYSYNWSGPGLYSYNEDVSGLSAGTFSVNVYDNQSCYVYASFTLSDPPSMSVSEVITDVMCSGDSTGAIDITVQNGNAPYTYEWSYMSGVNKQVNVVENPLFSGIISTQEDLTNVPAGSYYLSVTDVLGCIISSSFYLNENQPINISFYPTDPHCNMSDGSIIANANGGIYPYTYYWLNGDTTSITDSIPAGQYSVTVTDSLGCNINSSVALSNIGGPTLSFASYDASCYGYSDGSANVVVQGLASSILWSNNTTNDTISGVLAGIYYAEVTDLNGCVAIGSVNVYQPDSLSINVYAMNPTCNGDTNGYISANGSGGSWEYSFLWSNDSSLSYMSNLVAGTYVVTMTDAMNSGCSKVASVILTEPPPIVINGITATDVTCYGFYDGTITIDASAGSETLEYGDGEMGYYPQNTFTGLSGSTYNYGIRIASGNSNCEISTGDIIINEPTQLLGSFEQTNITCFGANNGTITFIPYGGTSPYEYSIDGEITFGTDSALTDLVPGFYSLKIRDANGCLYKPGDVSMPEPSDINMNLYGSALYCYGDTSGHVEMIVFGAFPPYSFNWSNGDTTQNISNVTAGNFIVTVTDNHNCNYIDSIEVTQPDQLLLNSVVANALCFGSNDGTIDLNPSGGTPAYNYWWADTAFTQIRTGLSIGVYYATVTDYFGCSANAIVTVGQPSVLQPLTTFTNATCFASDNGSATGNASGGTSPYSYYWSTDATTDNITGLAPTIYTVTVTDANACTAIDTFIITEPVQLIITNTNTVNLTCYGDTSGSITAIATGGTGALQYTLDNLNFQSTGIFSNLIAGTYSVQVIDANGCNDVTPVITVTEPGQISTVITSSDVTCFGAADGNATVTVSGGTGAFTYSWNQGLYTTPNISNLPVGTYVASVTDANNCSVTDTVIITQPAQLIVTTNSTNVSCNGVCDGTANLVASGGVFPYTYLWNTVPASTVASVTVCAGLYTATVTDATGCTATSNFSITEPEAFSLVISSTVSACNICNGTATVTTTGGTIPYNYLWSNNDVLTFADSLCAGTFVVTVTDVNGCNSSMSVNISSQAFSNISGEAHWSQGILADNIAEVKLYRILNITQTELAYTMPLTGSQFNFTNVSYGNYFIKVNITNGTGMQNVLSTYLDSTYLWELADTLNVTCANNFNLHIPMYEMTQPVGPQIGIISGTIVYADYSGGGKGITAAEGINLAGEPVPGAEIYVELEPDDEPIINTTTNDTGFYFVSGLEGGNTYSMSVDIPGLPMITTYTHINITNDSSEYTQMNFYVDTSETNGGIFISSSTPVIKHENALFNLEMYPNPFSEYMNINYNLSKSGNVNLEIYDILGNVVAILVKEKQNEGSYKYVFNAFAVSLAEGTYIVKLQVDNTVFIKKILQIK